MAEEPLVIQYLRTTLEALWTLLLMNFHLLKAFVRWIVPPTPKDVSEEDVVLISGAGHGIGRELAMRFARLGALVLAVDVNQAGTEETVQMVKCQNLKIQGYVCDVSDRAAVCKLAERVCKEVGDVTILVNNAGIMPCKPFLRHSEKEIRSQMDINVIGGLWMIQAFLPAMLKNNKGHIVAVSSMAGMMGLRNLVPYCGTKHAVRGYMDALAMELHEDPRDSSGIKFTTIYPYIVNTGLVHNPSIRFKKLLKTVEPGDAADQIVDAVRRNYVEITIPSELFYLAKIFNTLPTSASLVLKDFLQTGLNPHD